MPEGWILHWAWPHSPKQRLPTSFLFLRPLFCSSHLSHRLSYGCRVIVALLETPLSTGQMMCSLHVHSGILDVVPNWHYNSI